MDWLATGKWLTRARVTRVAVISALSGGLMLLFLWIGGHGTVDYLGKPIGSDFTAFWNAGHIAGGGDAASAWDQSLLHESIRATHGVEYGTAWIYPPVFLFVAVPLGAIAYLPALLIWQLLSLVAVALILKAILKTKYDTLVALASPMTPLVLANGQNSFLTAALLGGGLLLLESRPKLAGTFLGGLIYKPQLGLVIAPLLLFSKSWRTVATAAAAAAALIGASIVLWGIDCWPAWLSSLRYGRFYLEQGSVGFYKSASIFSAARGWGARTDAAYVLQILGMILALVLIWRARTAPNAIRAAAACAAAALSTPYLLDYDMAIVGMGAAFLYAQAREDGLFLPYELSAYSFIWIGPWFSRPAAEYAFLPLAPVATLLLTWMAWRRASEHRHATVDVQGLASDVPGLAAG